MKGFLKVYEDEIEILLILKVFLAQKSEIVYLLGSTSSFSEIGLFFSNYLFCLMMELFNRHFQSDLSLCVRQSLDIKSVNF